MPNPKVIKSNLKYEMILIVVEALNRNKNNRTKTAEELGVSVRSVRTWIKQAREIGFDIPDHKPWEWRKKVC